MPDESVLPSSPSQQKRFLAGSLILAIGIAFCYFFAYKPLHTLTTTGHTEYSLKGVLFGPLFVYLGILITLGLHRGCTTRSQDGRGKATYTRKGWIVLAGAVVVVALTMAGWYAYLGAIGGVEQGPTL